MYIYYKCINGVECEKIPIVYSAVEACIQKISI